MENINLKKVLGHYGAEIFTEWNDHATFLMEICYTADSYNVFWCHSADETIPNISEDVFYYVENCVDVFKDALKAGESIYVDIDLYDDMNVDDLIDEIATNNLDL